jgi:hypothetical protein
MMLAKPVVRWGRKATGLEVLLKIAGLLRVFR